MQLPRTDPCALIRAELELEHLFALTLLGAIFDYPGATARSALLAELADLGRVRYERANAANDGSTYVVEIGGAPLAGFLVALAGAATVLWFDALTFAASALLVALLVPATRREVPTREPLFSHAVEGFRFIRRDRLITWLLVTSMVSNFVLAPLGAVLIPPARELSARVRRLQRDHDRRVPQSGAVRDESSPPRGVGRRAPAEARSCVRAAQRPQTSRIVARRARRPRRRATRPSSPYRRRV